MIKNIIQHRIISGKNIKGTKLISLNKVAENMGTELENQRIDTCLNCKMLDCKGECPKSPSDWEKEKIKRAKIKREKITKFENLSLETIADGVNYWSEEQTDSFFSRFWKRRKV